MHACEDQESNGEATREIVQSHKPHRGTSKAVKEDLRVHHDEDKQVAEHPVGDEQQEILVVVHTNAVADPGAVMIEPHHALAADRAVVRSGWPKALALGTESPVCQPVLVFLEISPHSVLDRYVLMLF